MSHENIDNAVVEQKALVAALKKTPNDFLFGAETFLDFLECHDDSNFADLIESLGSIAKSILEDAEIVS